MQVVGEVARRAVAPFALLLDGAQDDPVQVGLRRARRPPAARGRRLAAGVAGARAGAGPHARPWGDHLADDPQHLAVPRPEQRARVERQRAGDQDVQDDAEGVDVGARVDVLDLEVGLLRTHVLGSSEDAPCAREQRLLGQPLRSRLGEPEVDDLRHRTPVLLGDEHVGGLQVAVDDGLLVRVLDALADLDEEREARC